MDGEEIDLKQTKDESDWISGIINKDLIKANILEYLASEGEEKNKIKEDIESILEIKRNLELLSDHSLARAPTRAKASDGIFTIGTVINAGKELYPFRLGQIDFSNHLMIVGRPNQGKSTLMASILLQLIEHDDSFVMFDPKNDFAGLTKLNSEIYAVDANKDLRFNIFEAPPEVEPKVWRNLVIDGFASVFGFYHGTKAYLARAVNQIVDERGDDYHAGHVYELIRGQSESTRVNADYRDVLLSRLELMNQCKEVFWCTKSMPFQDMKWLIVRTHKVAIEINSLLFELILLREYTYRMVNGIKDDAAKLKVIGSDEASKGSLSNARQHDWSSRELGAPPITRVLTQSRQFKIGMMAADQLYSSLSDVLKSVASTKIIGRLNSGRDIEEATDDMILDEDRETIPKLQIGEWIVRTQRINKPFMIRSQNVMIPKITEEEIEAHMVDKRFWIEKEKQIEQIKKSVSSVLSQDEWYLLTHVNEHPFTQFSNRLKQGMGKGRLELAKHLLIEKGLAIERTIRLGAYRPWRILELTEDAIKLLASVNHNTAFWRHIRNRGIEHQLWQYLLGDKLKQIGFEEVHREKTIQIDGGQRIIDVYWEHEKKHFGCEVECSTSDIENKVRALEKLDMVVLAYSTEEALNRAKDWLTQHKELENKVRLVLLPNYLKELQSLIRADETRQKPNHRGKVDSNSDGTKGGLK